MCIYTHTICFCKKPFVTLYCCIGGNVGVQMLASLQQQQHLLNAFMNQQNRRGGILDTPNQRFQVIFSFIYCFIYVVLII